VKEDKNGSRRQVRCRWFLSRFHSPSCLSRVWYRPCQSISYSYILYFLVYHKCLVVHADMHT
jgi:hypothetical protein